MTDHSNDVTIHGYPPIPDPGLTREEAEFFADGPRHTTECRSRWSPMSDKCHCQWEHRAQTIKASGKAKLRASLVSLEGQSEGDAGLSPRLVADAKQGGHDVS